MRNINTKKLSKNDARNVILLLISMVLAYLFASLYFMDHCFLNTVINGVDVSLKSHDDIEGIFRSHVKDYKLQLIERDGGTEEILGQDIKLQYNDINGIDQVYARQNPFKWLSVLIKQQKYYVYDLFVFDKEALENRINELDCLNKDIIEPQNVSFQFVNGSYEVIKEIYGNKVDRAKLQAAVQRNILQGKTKLDMDENSCYHNPRYTIASDKIPKTKDSLDKYAATRITYILRNENETLDGSTINQWLSVDADLEAVIDEKAVKEYVQGLSKKYDTVGTARKMKTSTNKIVEVKGGFYGWKINCAAEAKALMENIKNGQTLEREPIYAQKALSRDKNDIGRTYVEINITRQHLWFYKDGRLIARGAVVTGNPNKGYSTKTGVYMLNYKEKDSVLRGQDYEAEVQYWMPFNGNIGIHDASWRYSFGGEIYKRNGTHGCVNVPVYLAKVIFDNIEDGTPIICYEE